MEAAKKCRRIYGLDQIFFGVYVNSMLRTPKKKPLRPKSGAKGRVKKPRLGSPKKPSPPPGAGKEIGRVVAFFRIPVVAVVQVRNGPLKLGERIWITGHTTDLKETIASMQINHQPIQVAKKGDEVGIKVSSRARCGDRVYRIAP